MSKCVQCGNEVPIFKDDLRFRNGTCIKRKGEFAGSTWMRFADPDRFFCTMRCAARYGIGVARQRKQL
jgi:hypothetical protein